MRKIFFLLFISSLNIFSQNIQVNKIEPANWWTGMKLNKIQLMVYGKNLSDYKAYFNTKFISVDSVHTIKNTDYSFIDITISKNAKEGNYKLTFKQNKNSAEVNFPLFKKNKGAKIHQGFNRDDVIYLIVPDRFSDGDSTNNEVNGMVNEYHPKDHLGRHGGDLQGIINHLNYFVDLGVTSLWLTPVLENNKSISYHGYAATDLYKVDARFGGNEKYKELVDKAHAAGLKVIYDHVSNHIGTNHTWVSNLPMPGWLNGTKESHLNAWHDKMVTLDPHRVQTTYDHLIKGWFVDDMADMNQKNIYVKNYLIQNTIWWIEYAGIDGVREDTYPYSDEKFLSDWANTIMNEYPGFNIVGEVWTGETPFLAAFQKDSKLNNKINTNLPVVTDFAIQNSYADFLEGKSNLYRIYETVTKDFLYEKPDNILTFADNHDVTRVMFTGKEDVAKVKLVLTHLLTSRGIPQLLYATEIGMVGSAEHGILRSDFPGGFYGDKANAFTKEGRNEKENDLYNYVHDLLQARKKYHSLSKGELRHLPPQDNIYLYMKSLGEEKMLIIMNGDDKEKEVDSSSIDALCGNWDKLISVFNGSDKSSANAKFLVKPMSSEVYLVK
jgi:neopullulanase